MRNEVGTGAVRRALMWPSHGGKGQEGLHTTAHGRRSIKQGLCKTEPNSEVIIKGMRENWGSEEKKEEKPSPCAQDVHRPRKETEEETRAKAPHWVHQTIFHVNGSREAELQPWEHSWTASPRPGMFQETTASGGQPPASGCVNPELTYRSGESDSPSLAVRILLTQYLPVPNL